MLYIRRWQLKLYTGTCVVMEMEEIGALTEAKTKYLKSLYVYHSVRKPCYAYEFCGFKQDNYRCVRCHRLEQSRYITIKYGAVYPVLKIST